MTRAVGVRTLIAARLSRAWDRGSLLYQQTGSLTTVVRFFARYGLRKIPLLISHTLSRRRRRAIAKTVAMGRGDELPQIAIRVSGGIGDYLVMARFLRDFHTFAGGITFDIYASVPNNAEWAMSDLPGFRACYPDSLFDRLRDQYDTALYLCQFAVVYSETTNWKAIRQWPRLMKVVGNIDHYRSKIDVFVSRHPWMDNFLAQKAVFAGATRRDFIHHIAGIPYGGDALPIRRPDDGAVILARLGLAQGSYITVHNGFDPGFIISGTRATKCYTEFATVVSEIKQRLTNTTVVQIGTSTSEPIAEADLDLIGETTLAEAAEIIRHSRLHIDNEGGLVHLAACLGVKSCVIFGPTPADYFGYPSNINIAPSSCGGCWWITATWMDRCPKGDTKPRCMASHDANDIAAVIVKELEMAQQ